MSRPVNPNVVRYLTPRPELVSERERQVGALLAAGVSTREIGRRLGLNAYQVTNARRLLYLKLRLHGVADLTRWAIGHGWIRLDGRPGPAREMRP